MRPFVVSLLLVTCACAKLAVWAAPEKTAVPANTPEAKAANRAFWDALHDGRYQDLPQVTEALQEVYLAHPADVDTAAHLGFAHIWRVAEGARLDHRPATLTDEVILARKYFGEAARLAPEDARFQGFYAGATLAEGMIHGDEKLKRTGYFAFKDALRMWPEFMLFTAAYGQSRLPLDNDKFKEALSYEWRTVDLCTGATVDRANPDVAPYLSRETHEGPKRACWNSWIAPHNFEGFFLNMGDMVVKQGDVATAKKLYANARLSRTYAAWPYRDVLERRIQQADENVARFRAAAKGERERTMMIASAFSCTGCHQDSRGEYPKTL